MIYAAMTFWLLMVVLTAGGVQRLWGGVVRPKVFNAILLPGTLVAQVGYVLGLLITGATVSETTLFKEDESGEPGTTRNPKPRIPVIGPVIIGLLPLLACAAAVYFAAHYLGRGMLANMRLQVVGPTLPTTIEGFWQFLRDQISLVEAVASATAAADFSTWKTWVFLYLLICLTIRMAPFPGNLRGSLVAILALGVTAAAISSLFDVADPRVQNVWAVLNLTVAALLFLLMLSLLVRGILGLVRVLREPAA